MTKIFTSLPSSSGTRMASLERESSFRTSIESLIQLADSRPDPPLQKLLSSLNGLSRHPSATSPSGITLDTLQSDVTETVLLVARHLNRLDKDDYALRVKSRFCQLIESILTREAVIATGPDGLLRNSLLEWFSKWSFEAQKDHDTYRTSSAKQSQSQRDLDHACLCALVVVTEGLQLKSTSDTSNETPSVVRARLFQRYLFQLTRVIEKSALSDDESTRHRAVYGENATRPRAEEPGTLAVMILSNLLSANIDIGLKHCLSLGYHEDPLLRSAFVQIMSSLLRTGARFGGLGGTQSQSRRPTPFLDVLVEDNLAFAVAICEVCPASEVDELLALLFRSLEAKASLMSLIKVMIEKEVAQTHHESELFRANSTMTKMLTVFGKTYGYNYVRSTLQPLIHSLVDRPAACSFELDPSKSGPNEDIDQNADHLRLMCQALLDLICSSAPRVPVMFRALCHQLWEIVEDRFPDSRHSAVGSFIFLRFFCPAIVSPEAVDLDVSSESREIRRALLLITKVIQNLANNVKFKEPHMQILNTFLGENIKQVTRFLSDVAMRPRSWELAQAVKTGSEEATRMQEAEVDNAILHRFVFKFYGRLQPVLETMPPSYRRSTTPRSARADIDGKLAVSRLIDLMRSSGEAVSPPALTGSAKTQAYEELIRQNEGRDTSSVAQAFYEGPASQNGRRIFYFVVSETALVDYDLLAYHIFTVVETAVESFDVVIDLTEFSPAVDLPRFWLQRIAQMAPSSLLSLVNTIALYNANSYAKKRIRRVISDLVPICGPVGQSLVSACSPAELAVAIPFTSLYLPTYTMALAYEANHVFTNLLRMSDHDSHVPVVVKLGVDSMQVASWRKLDLAQGLKGYVIDVIRLKDIDDIMHGTGAAADHLIIKYCQTECVIFVSRKRNELAHMIRAARARLRTTPSEERALRPSDVPGTLLNLALLNLSAGDETLRLGAYNLVGDVAKFFNFELYPSILIVKAGLMIPSNALSFARHLSKGLAKSAPQLTLEFLREWAIGFAKSDLPQKTACLLYVGPWISNLNTFAKRSRDNSEESIKQIGEIIRSLLSITIAERKRLHLSIQEHVWSKLASSPDVIDLMLPQLLNAATDGGIGSDRVECVGDILCSVSTTAIRGKVVAKLRKTIAQTYLKPSNTLADNTAWTEICALARVNLMLSFAPLDSLDTALFLPEIFHILTLLAGSGPLLMRQTIYGLLVNTTQSLASSSPTGEMDGIALQQALDKAQSDQIVTCFDLVEVGGSMEMAPVVNGKDDSDVSVLDHVGILASFLGDVLVAAAPNIDCANTWRARWMGLVVGTCFQHNPATQPRAFTVLGYLAADEVDDDLVYQILVAMSTTLSHMAESDSVLLNSMLRCLARVVPGLLPDSRYASSLFWLAFAITEMGYVPLFGAALELMLVAMKSLNEDTGIERVAQHLLDVRRAMGDAARRIDQIAGVSLDRDPSFCLAAIIVKGVRHPATCTIAKEVLMELLKMTVSQQQASGSEDETPLIPKSSVAYFVALLPVSANKVDDIRALFIAAGLEVDEESLKDLGTLSVFDLLSIPDNSSAIFLITLVVTALNSAPSDAERLVLYRLLADASSEMPEVLLMAYDSLLPRLSATINTSTNLALIQSANIVLSKARSDPSYHFPTTVPKTSDSQTSLQQSFKGSISSIPGGGSSATGGQMIRVLDDLGMKGLGEGGLAPVKTEKLSMMAKWVAALIESFTL